MKTIVNFSGFILISLFILSACNQAEDEIKINKISLSGQIKNIADTTLSFSFEPFTLLSSSQSVDLLVDSSGLFNLVLETNHPIKGFLSFGKIPKTYKFDIVQVNGKDSSLQVESVDFRMFYLYLSPGDNLKLSVDANQIRETLSFSGKGADNNIFVNQEEWTFNDYKSKYLNNYYTITYYQGDQYKSAKNDLYDTKKQSLEDFQIDHKLNDHLVKVYQYQYYQEYVRGLIYYPAGHAGFNNDQYPELPANYYEFMDKVMLPVNIDDLGVGAYYFLSSYLNKKFDLSDLKTQANTDFYDFMEEELPDRMAYVYKAYSLNRDFKKELYDVFGEDCPYPEIAKLVKKKYQHLEGMLEGSPGPDFTLKDVDGQVFELDDFRGNFVYIDFWATWCKPCVKEIPYLEILQEKFKGEPIKFVSISIDKEKDTLKWRNFVIENEMNGVQLWADEEHQNKFSQNLNIKSIPRFVLLDQEGKIIDAQAPRPSDPAIEKMFEKLTNYELLFLVDGQCEGYSCAEVGISLQSKIISL